MDIELIIQTFRPVTGTEVQTGGHRTHHSDIQTGDWDIELIVQTFRPPLFVCVVVVVLLLLLLLLFATGLDGQPASETGTKL